MRFRLYAPAADALGGAVLAAALLYALCCPGAAAVRFAWAAAVGGGVWLWARLYVGCTRWGVRGTALYLRTGIPAARVRLIPLRAVTSVRCSRMPLGGCVLHIRWPGGHAALRFVRRADALTLQRRWQQTARE